MLTDRQLRSLRILTYSLLALLTATGMVILARRDYLLFHVFAELFSIVIAFGVFAIAWNTRRILQNGAVMVLGIGSLVVGLMDLLHTISYSGMNLLATQSPNEATQLWIAARGMQALVFISAPFFIRRRPNAHLLLWTGLLVSGILTSSILWWRIFPDCFVAGRLPPLTTFKVLAEYVICAALAVSGWLFLRRGKSLDQWVLRFLIGAITASVFSEVVFTQYVRVDGAINMTGHLLKIAAFFLLYKAIVEIGLRRPYDLLFRDLKLHEESLETARSALEIVVSQRTDELRTANEQLSMEAAEREKAGHRLQLTNRLLQLLVDKGARQEYLGAVVDELHALTGCRCIGIRVRDAAGNIPYDAWRGFDEDFMKQEGNLAIGENACSCARVITGALEAQDKPIISAFGSLNCGNLVEFLNAVPPERRVRYRGHCMRAGFKTLVLVPVRCYGQIVGAIHLADERPGVISAEALSLMESLSPLIGEAAHRYAIEDQLRQLNEELEKRVTDRTRELADARNAAETRAAELHAANQDLEAFSYSVSHDLRGPVRTIDGFTRFLSQELGSAAGANATKYVSIIQSEAARMERLIVDLLAFSRLGRQEVKQSRLDMTSIARDCCASLNHSAAGRAIRFEISDLPPTRGDEAMIRQVFMNLLGNAVKFTAVRPEAVIQVSGHLDDGESVYIVRDNGIGFDMKYIGKLFAVFQRLHRIDEYEGSGVGLAIVKRIIERHGGRIWAESSLDRGASFFFALPKTTGESEAVSDLGEVARSI